MIEYQRGKLATLYITFTSNGVVNDPDTLNVAVYHKNEEIIEPTSMTKISTGFYYYSFNIPNTWALDIYAAVYSGIINGHEFQTSEVFKVTKEISIIGGEEPIDTYCSVGDVENELAGIDYSNIDNVGTMIVNYITWAEQEINRRTNRSFKPVNDIILLDGFNTPELVLPHHPILSVGSCVLEDRYSFENIAYINTYDKKIGDNVTEKSGEEAIKNADLLVDCVNGILIIPQKNINMNIINNMQYVGSTHGRNIFITGVRNIRVSCEHGYPVGYLPKDIRDACAKLVAIRILQKHSDEVGKGANSLSVDGFGKSWGGRPFSERIAELQLSIESILSSYRNIGIN